MSWIHIVMKFCPICDSVMTKITTISGLIVFQCRCQKTIEGTAEDSLMFEDDAEYNASELKHEVFIENAPYDLAGHTVLKDCPRCSLNFMTMIIPGDNQMAMYVCMCGYKGTEGVTAKELKTV